MTWSSQFCRVGQRARGQDRPESSRTGAACTGRVEPWGGRVCTGYVHSLWRVTDILGLGYHGGRRNSVLKIVICRVDSHEIGRPAACYSGFSTMGPSPVAHWSGGKTSAIFSHQKR